MPKRKLQKELFRLLDNDENYDAMINHKNKTIISN